MKNQDVRLGDCMEEDLVEEIFGSVSEFSRLVEEKGDNFQVNRIKVVYDDVLDMHSFFLTPKLSAKNV